MKKGSNPRSNDRENIVRNIEKGAYVHKPRRTSNPQRQQSNTQKPNQQSATAGCETGQGAGQTNSRDKE